MVYIAETTSSAIRLNATWALTHAAMSLLRDRYEQTVRFSWLLRSSNDDEYHKYGRAFFSKVNTLTRSMSPKARKHYDEMVGPSPEWATTAMTKDQRSYLEKWNALDLLSMATKRDALPPIGDIELAKATLADLYYGIYAQFSSVTHYDRYGIELLSLHKPKTSDGPLILAADPRWPAMLTLNNSLLDLIQCYEAANLCAGKDGASLASLYEEWKFLTKRTLA